MNTAVMCENSHFYDYEKLQKVNKREVWCGNYKCF